MYKPAALLIDTALNYVQKLNISPFHPIDTVR